MSKYTDESHPDFKALKKADKAVQESVQFVNDHQKLLEAKRRLQEVTSAFVGLPAGLDLDGDKERRFLSECHVKELVDVATQLSEDRTLFLFSDVLIVAKPQTRSKLLAYKVHVPLQHLVCKDMPPNPALPHGMLLQNSTAHSGAVMANFADAAQKKKFSAEVDKAKAELGDKPITLESAPSRAKPADKLTAARGPQKPVLPPNPTPEQYKAFMRAKYEYEQWQNEQLRKSSPSVESSPKPQRRVPSPVPPPLNAAPPAATGGPPPIPMENGVVPGERAGTMKRMCRKCVQRKAVAKVTHSDGQVVKVCEVCLKDYERPSGAAPVPESAKRKASEPAPAATPAATSQPAAAAAAAPQAATQQAATQQAAAQQPAAAATQQEAAKPAPPPVAPAAGQLPLKPKWHAVHMDDGRVYYFHEETQETTWERPVVEAAPSLPPPPAVGATGAAALPPPIAQ